MKNLSKKYSWVFEGIALILVVALGIYLLVDTSAVLFIVGLLFVLFGLVRIIPLVKTTKDKLMKWIFLFEILVDIAIGIIVFCQGLKGNSLGKLTGFLIGFVLYLRGFLFFFGAVIRKEYSELMQFIIAILMISLGAFIFGMGTITENTIRWVIILIAIGVIMFLGYNTFKGYKNYRNEYVVRRETKNVTTSEIVKEAPKSDKIKDVIIEDDSEEINEIRG